MNFRVKFIIFSCLQTPCTLRHIYRQAWALNLNLRKMSTWEKLVIAYCRSDSIQYSTVWLIDFSHVLHYVIVKCIMAVTAAVCRLLILIRIHCNVFLSDCGQVRQLCRDRDRCENRLQQSWHLAVQTNYDGPQPQENLNVPRLGSLHFPLSFLGQTVPLEQQTSHWKCDHLDNPPDGSWISPLPQVAD